MSITIGQEKIFKSKVGIWSKVAGSMQMVEEGYLDDKLRRRAIGEYNRWVDNEAISMTMKLDEIRGNKRKDLIPPHQTLVIFGSRSILHQAFIEFLSLNMIKNLLLPDGHHSPKPRN